MTTALLDPPGDTPPGIVDDDHPAPPTDDTTRREFLILALYSGITQGDYDRLRRIAPTVAQPPEYIDYGVPWQDLTRGVAVAVGRADRGEQLIAGIEARFAGVCSAHPGVAGATFAATGPAEGGIYGVNASEDPRSRIFADLGFRVCRHDHHAAGVSRSGRGR